MTHHILVRYGEIGTKSEPVRRNMESRLRQRVEDRLEYEGFEYDRVGKHRGRIIVHEVEERAVEAVAEVPGVSSASPALKTDASIESLKELVEQFEVGETFGVDASTANTQMSSQDIKIELGSHIEELTGSSVDLDEPDTWIEVEVRGEDAYMFTETFRGPDGYPVGSEEPLAALISGGIDSPVAAYEVMKRGSDIVPVYFYNKPIAAEDHMLRFLSAVKKLERFNPAKKWEYFVVDMDEVNRELMKVGRGRMVLHRRIMFQVAERLAGEEGLEGLVTGESMGQKSSQTPSNLAMTTASVELPVFRPLLTSNKNQIVERAREIDTFEDSTIDSACRTLSPENPATTMTDERLDKLVEKVDEESLVETAVENAEKKEL